ncbi:MAG TPA: branched-chain amino acid ABC transporter permease [Gaiellaceae bacterium]|nr:branched-chain amino acid ABC transporter permease [Gaiellaceae bacterium]
MSDRWRRIEPVARRLWAPFALCSLLVVTWWLLDDFGGEIYQAYGIRMFLNLMIVLALQIFSGNSGVLSFGHATFVAMGAYFSALLTIPPADKTFQFLTMPHWLRSWIFPAHLSALEAILAGAGFAMAIAALLAPPVVRLAGVQAGIATLAILVMDNVFNTQTTSITRGTSTLIAVPQTTTFVSLLVWALIFVGVAYMFKQSRFGLRLRATRENVRAARSVGVSVAKERAIAWILSGFVAGAAGALYGHWFVTFSPGDFYFNTNGIDLVILPIAMLVIGGMGSVTGAVVGCYVVTVVYTFFNRWEVDGFGGTVGTAPSGTANLVLAVTFLVVLFLRPRGLAGGAELTWPTDWRLPRFHLPGRARVSPLAGGASGAEPPVEVPERPASSVE